MTESFGWNDSESWKALAKEIQSRFPALETPEADLKQLLTSAKPGTPTQVVQFSSLITQTVGSLAHCVELKQAALSAGLLDLPNPLQVETLLTEAAALLERAIAGREEISRLKISLFEQVLDFLEFQALDSIHGHEINAGRYALPELDRKAEVAAAEAAVQSSAAELKALQEFADWFAPKGVETVNARTRQASKLTSSTSVPQQARESDPSVPTTFSGIIESLANPVHEIGLFETYYNTQGRIAAISEGLAKTEERIGILKILAEKVACCRFFGHEVKLA